MEYFENMRIQHKMFGVLGSIILVSALITMWNVYNIIQIDIEAGHMLREIGKLDDVEQAHIEFLTQEVLEKDYLLTGEQYYLNQHEVSQELTSLFLENSLLKAQSFSDKSKIFGLIEKNVAYQQVFDHVVEEYEHGDFDDAIQMSINESEAMIQEIHHSIEGFMEEGAAMIVEEGKQADRQALLSIVIGAIGIIFFVILTVVGGRVAYLQIGAPTIQIETAIMAIGDGTYKANQLKELLSKEDEVGRIARQVRDMAKAAAKREKDALAEIKILQKELKLGKK